jgi:hypothetical protein
VENEFEKSNMVERNGTGAGVHAEFMRQVMQVTVWMRAKHNSKVRVNTDL